ncbi:MAG TPA: DUF1566 domain-containing protein [Myxococcaceae bacterium]
MERRSAHPGIRLLSEVCAVLLLPSVCACTRSEAAGIDDRRTAESAQTSFEERFIVGRDGTALDRQTGLTWQRCPVGTSLDDRGTPAALEDDRCITIPGDPQTLTWKAAVAEARQLDESGGFAGHVDWRVPGQKELLSVVEARWRQPKVVGHVFPLTPPDPFQVATIYSAIETLSWEAHSRRGASPAVRVRLVRR